ncbi:MAG TPA: winged helix-turn-helix domain-containing protein [Solirubrobacterales bacterium]
MFADELDLKIITELYMRAMSPKQFVEEFGGGTVSRVDRHFKKLAKHGWLRLIRKVSGDGRRGGTEHVYRARELAVFDNETWALLPYSIRVEFSGTILKQFAERVQNALEAKTFDARPDRHFTWTPILLDRIGWERVIARIDSLFESLYEEQEDARLRVYSSEEKPFLATVALAGFESPTWPREAGVARTAARLADAVDCPFPFTLRIAKVFADPLCLKIVTELNRRTMSPKQFYEEFGGASHSAICHRFKMLAEHGWLKNVEQKTGGKRRGATELFYQATGPAVLGNDAWSDIPDSIKTNISWTIFEQFSDQAKEAMAAGTLDARPDRHLSWSLFHLDQLGWENVVGSVDALFEFLFEEEKSAEQRMDASGEEPITMTVALAAFESPKDSAKAP